MLLLPFWDQMRRQGGHVFNQRWDPAAHIKKNTQRLRGSVHGESCVAAQILSLYNIYIHTAQHKNVDLILYS